MGNNPSINCLDLKGQHQQIKEEVFALYEEVYANTAFSNGPFVKRFEEAFASLCGTEYAIAVNSGTSALHLAMLALDIGPGDEVILPANTFIATAWGVSYVGATPVFADCDPNTWEVDPEDVKKRITDKTKAIIGVHLYGCPCDLSALQAIADEHGLHLVEDAAQAHGATYNGTTVGSFGKMACFSFYPGKNLGATGEGGGITTNDEALKNRLDSLRNHGSTQRYYHDEVGYNYRMGGLEGASLSVKVKYITGWNARRQAIAARYQQEVTNPLIKMQTIPDNVTSVYHLFVVTTDNKDALLDHMKSNGVNPAFHYPVPCHLQKAYANLGHEVGDFPHSEYLAAHCVSLPMYAELTDEQVDHVIQMLNAYSA